MENVMADFEKQWEAGTFPGWQVSIRQFACTIKGKLVNFDKKMQFLNFSISLQHH
ncbi:MAG: hypothetical protein O7D30_02270 [Rickettsia endosymbiont of Ixodes persulcatus]|nr:hypothetical protein [Rickettsia endosymbiont of Ixodes persulcatus]